MKKAVLMIAVLSGACDDDPQELAVDAPPAPTPDAQVDASVPPPPANLCPLPQPRDLDATLAWYGTNRERLDCFVDRVGCRAEGYDPDAKPVALFDWDNTVIKNDVGDAMTFWMIGHAKILQPPDADWAQTSPYLAAAALSALAAACPTSAEVAPGAALPTDTDLDCATELASIYFDGKTAAGATAWTGTHDYRRMEPAYAWAAQLLAGYTPAEVEGFAAQAIAEFLAREEGATITVGTKAGLNGYLRLYPQIVDLIGTMQENGLDVWVITASPEPVVRAFAPMAGVAADKVIGIRQTLEGGRLGRAFLGCGGLPDGQTEMITYIDGKRCWVNRVIWGDTSASAFEARAGVRQVFGAGDSDTDITFLRDATELKLAINRGKKELMCNAYDDYQGRWLVNPMFIAPRACATAPYTCSTSGCKDATGASVPCLSEDGTTTIPDQADNVCP